MFSTSLINGATAITPAPTLSDEGLSLVAAIEASAEARDEAMVQVSITGTATVQLFGRLARNRPWVQLGTDITATGLFPISRVPFVFARVSAASGGATVSVDVGY